MTECARPRWLGAGFGDDADPEVAGRLAAQAATAGRAAELMLVFSSFADGLERLLDGVRSQAAAGTVIVGCSTFGEVIDGRGDPTAPGVVVAALGGEGLEVHTRVGRGASGDRREAGRAAAEAATLLQAPERICLLLCDGLVGEQHDVIRGAYSVLGVTTRLVGGCAGDAGSYAKTFQFLGDRSAVEIMSDSVIGVGLGSTGRFGVGIAHGWSKSGEAMIVTSSADGRLASLDERPALDVYLDRIGADRSLLDDPAAFRDRAYASPLGMSRRNSEDIRVVHAGDLTDGSLQCLADIPQGALTWVMQAHPDSLIAAGADSCAQAIDDLGGEEPVGLLVFDCGARKAVLGEAMREEISAMVKVADGVPLAGMYTYGEIARTHGSRGMHHLTAVTLAVS